MVRAEQGHDGGAGAPTSASTKSAVYDADQEMEALVSAWWAEARGMPMATSLPRLGARIAEALERAYATGVSHGMTQHPGQGAPDHGIGQAVRQGIRQGAKRATQVPPA